MDEKFCILNRILLKFIPKGSIDNMSALVQVMVWCLTGDKPLPKVILISLTYVCGTRERWVKVMACRMFCENHDLYLCRPVTIYNHRNNLEWNFNENITHLTLENAFWVISKFFTTFPSLFLLTHGGRVMHICVSKLTSTGSDNGLSPGRRQAIIWSNDGIFLIPTLGTNISEILSKIHTFSLKKICLNMSFAKCCSFRLGLNVVSVTMSAFWPSATILCHKTWSSLVQAPVCWLLSSNSIPEPMIIYYH